jgi:hypothetical protein
LDIALISLDRLISLNSSVIYFSHFGKADNSTQRLKDYRTQIQLWGKIAEDGVHRNQSFEQIRDRIIAEDQVMNQIIAFVKNHRIYSKTILENCIKGFIEYAKQKQTGKMS